MRRFAPALTVLALAVIPIAARAGLLELLRGYRELEVITVTDVSNYGNFLPQATPAAPQYYVAISLGYRDLGGYMAGIKQPPAEDVLRLLSAELAKQGYLPSTPRSPAPTLLLVYTWGTLNADKFYGPDPSMPAAQINRGQIVSFLGGRKVGMDRDFFNPLTAPIIGLTAYNYKARSLYEVAAEDFYVIAVGAYDLETALQKKHQPALWTTRIAAPSLGFSMADVVPAMLAIGGRQFGRETPQPVWINASDKFKPDVRLGELQLLDYLKDDPLPVTDQSETLRDKKK
jgi:hypothetical protein